jgi:acyl dehydratase
MSEIRRKTILGIRPGDRFELTRRFNEQDVRDFALVSRDDNPIHYDSDFIRSKNMTGPICHGLLVASLLTEIGGQIGWLAGGMDLKFIKPVYIGDTVRCIFTVTEIGEKNRARAEIRFINQLRETVIEATLTGILPNECERKILNRLINTPTNDRYPIASSSCIPDL